jgi:predicted O-linked N-acetylglucosamine transferase (SPINDLY family)
MRLLKEVSGSILWLKEPRESVKFKLRQEAERRGVDSQRLLFAGRLEIENYLARYRLADVFLDTLPYNAHATASDALSMGLPLITCRGPTFASRVGASLLHGAGLPELVAGDLHAYEILALSLAKNPELLQSLRRKLDANRVAKPLFDMNLFRQHIERAYTVMWQAAESGKPHSFSL